MHSALSPERACENKQPKTVVSYVAMCASEKCLDTPVRYVT